MLFLAQVSEGVGPQEGGLVAGAKALLQGQQGRAHAGAGANHRAVHIAGASPLVPLRARSPCSCRGAMVDVASVLASVLYLLHFSEATYNLACRPWGPPFAQSRSSYMLQCLFPGCWTAATAGN